MKEMFDSEINERHIMYKKSLTILFIFLLIASFSINAQDSLETKPDSIEAVTDTSDSNEAEASLVYRINIEGAIGTVTNDRIKEAIELAEENNAELLLITINTPGGFSNATRDICSNILNSEVPVCVYVSPSGAHAGSAGVYITYSAHFAAMAHSTNIGSAHPVSGDGKEIDSVMNEKVTNDAVAQIKSYAEKHNRNIEWAEKAVRESVNITDKEALELNVIEYRAATIDDLLNQIDGKETETASGPKTMALKDRKVETIERTFVQTLLELITDPNIVFILFSIGMLGITLELYNPGTILPGVVGTISLILALYSFQTLPINYAGVILILLAAIMFIAEIKVVSHGLLTVGGLISLFFGGIMLVDTVDPNLRVSLTVIITVVGFIGLLLSIVLYLLIRDSHLKPFIGNEGMTGKIAEGRRNGMVYVDGALWKAECDLEITEGDKFEIIDVDNLLLKVKKL